MDIGIGWLLLSAAGTFLLGMALESWSNRKKDSMNEYRKKDRRSEFDKRKRPILVWIHTTGGSVLRMWADHEYIQNVLIEPMSKNPNACLTQRPSEDSIESMGFNLVLNQVTYIEWQRMY